jgi:two-component system, NtrC family, sensor histidine kinase KinB
MQEISTWLPILFLLAIVVALILYIWNQQEHQALIDSMRDGLVVLNRRHRVINANLPAQQILKRPLAELQSLPLSELLPAGVSLPADGTGRELALDQGDQPRYYDCHLSPLLNRLGRLSGWLLVLRDITERREMERSLMAQKELFESLVAVARTVTEISTLANTLQNAVDVAANLTKAEYGSLILVDKNRYVSHSIIALGQVEPVGHEVIARRVLDRGLAGWVANHLESALIQDTRQDARWLPAAGGVYTARSALAVPIVIGSTLLGVLTLTHSEPGRFSLEEAELMQAAVDQIALALRNAQMYEEQRRLAQYQLTVYEVLRTVGSHLDVNLVAREAVQAIARLTAWPFVSLLAPDDSESHLMILAAAGEKTPDRELESISVVTGIVGRAYQSRETQYVPDVTSDPDYVDRLANTRSELTVPLVRGDRILGLLNMESDELDGFDRDDRQMAAALAEAVALALDNARLHTEMRQYATDLTTLYTVTRTLSHSLVLEDVLSQTLAVLLASLRFDAGLIAVVESETTDLALVAQQGLAPSVINRLQTEGFAGTLAEYVYRSREELALGDLYQKTAEVEQVTSLLPQAVAELEAMAMRACVAIPLLHQERSLGVICLLAQQPYVVSNEERTLRATIGQQVATTIVNIRLFRTAADERTLFQAVIESSRDGIILVGIKQDILVINAAALNLLGLHSRPRDWLNLPVQVMLAALERHAPETSEAILVELQRSPERALMNRGEFDVPPRLVHWLSLPVTAGTTSLGRLLVLRDVTEERLLERMRQDLTHTTVHDLRNPLSGMFTALELLERDARSLFSDEQRQVLQIVRNNTQRMLRLVNAILDISQLESGLMPLDRVPFHLGDLIADLLPTQLPLALEKKIRLESDVPPDLPPVFADRELIDRVLQNLLGNAIKFTPRQGVVQVKVRPPTPSEPWVLVAVSDSGKGIPPEIQSRLFQKYTTGGHEERGTGLGLAFCRMVMKAHGELIWAESPPGAGATFLFTLPLAEQGGRDGGVGINDPS